MNDINCIDISSLTFENQPFPHLCAISILQNDIDCHLFDWLEHTEEWYLVETEFYQQYEFSFLNIVLQDNLKCLISKKAIEEIEDNFKKIFKKKAFDLIDITAHKLINGQRIGVHNDYINDEETHRFVIHINPNWKESNGGFLMLFNSTKAEDVSKIIKPINNSAFGFEISKISHHAVSMIYDFTRYTVVYTFKAQS